LLLGIVGAGGVFCGANPAYHVDELLHMADIVNPRFVICSKTVVSTIVQMCEKKGIPNNCVFVLDDISVPKHSQDSKSSLAGYGRIEKNNCHATRLVRDLQKYGESPWLTLHDEASTKNSPAALFSTSGTTGLPKLASLSHYALVTQHISLFDTVPYDAVRLACLPFFHIFGAAWALFNPLRYGEPMYIMPRFFLDDYVSNISNYGITETYMAPPMVHELNRCGRPLQELLSTLQYVGVGGAPIDAAALRLFRAHLQPGATVTPVWGMTEFGPAVLFRWDEQDDTGSIGRPLRGYEVKLVDAAGEPILQDNRPGELLVRTAGVMTGYVGVPMDDEDGWFRTGDIAQVSEEKLYVVGRSKEMIKVKGYVFPSFSSGCDQLC
jgi:long-subunit acyl-CoA synthetase (AMP-forming)